MEKESEKEVGSLINELTYLRYLMNKGAIRECFRKMSIPEYIAMHNIADNSETAAIYEGRTYLKELSEKMKLTIRQTSKMVGALKERGLLVWSHDGNGSEGTYVTITETGKKMLGEQEALLKEFYGTVIVKFGRENLIRLLQLMKQLETVMSSTMEEMEGDNGNDDVCGYDE